MRTRIYLPETITITSPLYLHNATIRGRTSILHRRVWNRVLVWLHIYRVVRNEQELRTAIAKGEA